MASSQFTTLVKDAGSCKETLHEMGLEVLAIRSNLEFFMAGFRPGEDSQAIQARFAGRVQIGLERLAALGASVQNSLPPIVNDLLERGERPVAVTGDLSGSSYHDSPYLFDGMDPCIIELHAKAKEQICLSNNRRERFKRAASVFNLSFQERFPTIPPIKKPRASVLGFADLLGSPGGSAWNYCDAVIPADIKMVSIDSSPFSKKNSKEREDLQRVTSVNHDC